MLLFLFLIFYFSFLIGANSKYERLFTKDRMNKTLTHDYFIMIGVLSGSKIGIDLLTQHKVFFLYLSSSFSSPFFFLSFP